jgi:sugar/nucleoside kinase (ribokinase family)
MPDLLVVGGTFREIIVRRGEPDLRLAGSGLTAAVAAARMGVAVALASFVGAEDAQAAHALLQHASVEARLVVLEGASGTFVYPAAARDDPPQPLYRPAETSPTSFPSLPQSPVLLLFGLPDFDPVRDPAVIEVARGARLLIWDRQGWLSRTRSAAAAAALKARERVILLNAEEAIDENVLDPGSGDVRLPGGYDGGMIKDGVNGALIVDRNGTRTAIPAFPVDAQTTVGSGDVCAGVIASQLVTDNDLATAARRASAATAAVLASGDTFAPPDLRALMWRVLQEQTGTFAWRW